MLTLGTKFTQREITMRVDEEGPELDVCGKFVSQALEMVSQKSGSNGISLINQF